MYCIVCGEQSWCVTSEGDVQQHTLCYDCVAYGEVLEEAQTEAAIAAYEAETWGPEDGDCCPCGGPSCDGTCDSNVAPMTREEIYELGCQGCTSEECDECSEHNQFEGDCPF